MFPQLLERELRSKRVGGNEKLRSKYKENMRVQAEYSEDKKWYDAVILRVQPDGKFLVNFTEYGNSVPPSPPLLCVRICWLSSRRVGC